MSLTVLVGVFNENSQLLNTQLHTDHTQTAMCVLSLVFISQCTHISPTQSFSALTTTPIQTVIVISPQLCLHCIYSTLSHSILWHHTNTPTYIFYHKSTACVHSPLNKNCRTSQVAPATSKDPPHSTNTSYQYVTALSISSLDNEIVPV